MSFHPACRLCSNAMTDMCLTKCAVKRDFTHFAARKPANGMKIPPFPVEVLRKAPVRVQVQIIASYVEALVERTE